MKDIKYLIIPDVHGREFWKSPVEETLLQTTAEIVFLGDYHDPYPNECDSYEEYEEYTSKSVDRFKQILEIKEQNPERVTLLLGNHDCGYAYSERICSSRRDRAHAQELEKIFKSRRESFQLAKECTLGSRHIIFSHAGILKGWADQVWGEEDIAKFNIVDLLNNAWLTDQYEIMESLGMYDGYRGWGGYKYGSPVWSDIRSWIEVTPEETFGFNIAGHTQLNSPLVLDQIACLDCRRAFYLDSNGDIRDYESDEILKKTQLGDD